MEKERRSSAAESQEDSASAAEEIQPTRRAPAKKRKNQKKGGNSALDKLPVGGDDSLNNAVSGVTNTLGSVGGQALNQQQGGDSGGGKSDTLRLRLDLNLDIEIQLKARIHGDLELALLYVYPPSSILPPSPFRHPHPSLLPTHPPAQRIY